MSLGLLFIFKALFIRIDSRVHACLYYIYSTYTERTILSLEKNLHSSEEQKCTFSYIYHSFKKKYTLAIRQMEYKFNLLTIIHEN